MKRILSLCLALCLLLAGCGGNAASESTQSQTVTSPVAFEPSEVPADREFTAQVFAMDTFMDFKAYGPAAQSGLTDISTLITHLDRLLSVTDEHSDIYAVNHSGGAPVNVTSDTAEILAQALKLSGNLGDVLDVTVYPVSRAWGFTTGVYQIPSDEALHDLTALVDDSRVSLDGLTVSIPAGAELDLGAVAKGWAGDRAAGYLKEQGVTSALLNLGGSTIRTIGTKPDGAKWRIAIQDPDDPAGYAGLVEMGEGAVDTSGGYERYFEGDDGEIYWHILDPKTGYPAKAGLTSVTILSKDTFTGDGLSTALFVMGLDSAVDYWRQNRDFEFVLIDENGDLFVSEGAADVFTPLGSYENAVLTVIPYEE